MKGQYIPFTSDSDDSDIDSEIEACMNEGDNMLQGEKLSLIQGTNTYMNSLNVFVGRQNSGKTFSATKELIKVIKKHPETHLLVVVNKDGAPSDGTFETLKPLILIPIEYVSHENAVDFMKNLLEYKMIYNDIKSSGLEKQLPLNYKKELLDQLYINDLKRNYLHTLVLMEDATKSPLINKDGGYFNDLFTQCRHIQCSFFLNIHYWRALTTNIKSNISTAYIFGNFSRQQLQYILYQMNLESTPKEVYEVYKKLPTYNKLVVDCNTGTYKIT